MLVKNLKYGSKVESAPCRSSRVNIAPQNGTGPYNLNDQIIVNIPTRNNLVLVPTESYLKFTATVTSGANNNIVRWDSGGAHGLIQRLRVWSGSNLLEDVDCYGLLAKELFDLQVSTDASYGKYNILAGTRGDLVSNLGAIATANGTDLATTQTLANDIKTALNATKSVSQVNSGESLGTLANNGTYIATYCLNLVSILGTLSQQYFPLFACTSAPIRLEIQLVSTAVQALNASDVITSIALNNVEYVANFIELSDNAMGMIYSSLQGAPLQYVVPSYRNYQYSYLLATAQTQVAFPIPAKFSSLKSIVISIRDKLTGALTFFPNSSCTKKLIDYTFRVGSNIMPTKSPTTYQEMFSEVLKAVGSMSDLNHQPSIEKNSYTLQDSTANDANGTVNSGSFYIGLDVESYSNADKSQIFAGYNSNTDDIFCIMNFAAQAGNTTVRFDAFAMFDEVLVFENNTAYVKF